MKYQVLLYYLYTEIDNPSEFVKEHRELCEELNLLGRILIAKEGINGTVSGLIEDTNKYMETLQNHPLLKDITFKIDLSNEHAFKKLQIKEREFLVNLSLDEDINPNELTGDYVSPKEFYERLHDEDTVVIDARNTYEFDVGHFKGAIRPDIETFRELPQWIKENENLLKNKRILTYCTGGIRCEKFSGWLKKEGYQDVGQLAGGIATYGKDPEVLGKDWLGQMVVFDERLSVPVNQVDHIIVGKDHYDGTPCERMFNCSNPDCNKRLIGSKENQHKHHGACSPQCAAHPRNRYLQELNS